VVSLRNRRERRRLLLDRRWELAGFAMRYRLATTRAELLEFHPVWVIATVLLGYVIPLLAIYAGQRDLRTDISSLRSHDFS